MTGTRPPLAAFLRPELPDAALHGLAGEVAVTLAEASGADPAAVLMAFLAMLGNAAGPQPHAWFGGAQHPARLFCVLVGDAATGRKGTAFGAVERLLTEAEPEWSADRVMYGLQSGEALVAAVADGRMSDCRLVIAETEFARLVTTMSRSESLSSQLRNAWDGRALERTGTRTAQRASHAHVSLVAMITPEELLKHHSRLSQAGGLESRLLYAYSAPEADVSPFLSHAAVPGLADRVRVALDASREAVMMTTDPISRHLLAARSIQPKAVIPVTLDVTGAWGAEIRPRLMTVAKGVPSLHSRAESQVIRLAAAYALADSTGVIGREQVDAAVAAWSYCARSAEVVFSVPVAGLPPAADPRHSARIVRHLHSQWPGWVSRDEIGSDVLHGNVTKAAVTAALKSLSDSRLIEHREVLTEGRTRTEYRLSPQAPLFP